MVVSVGVSGGCVVVAGQELADAPGDLAPDVVLILFSGATKAEYFRVGGGHVVWDVVAYSRV